MKRIYFDISATTPLDKQVANFMHDIQQTIFGNPSSIHREGQSARAIIEKNRRKIAQYLNCSQEEIIFTSSGTESNNMVLKGVLNKGDHFITSSYEHPAILKVLPYLKNLGVDISIVKPNKNGIIESDLIEKNIRKNTKLVSIMFVNNELGTINDVTKIGLMLTKYKIPFHTDAVQAFGKLPIDMDIIPINFLSISAHKLYGPKGVGALYIRKGNSIKPLIYGGGQESNKRASTENIAGICGFGLATELAYKNLDYNTKHIQNLELHFLNLLDKHSINYKINGENRVHGVFNITLPAFNAQNLVLQLDMEGIGISLGSACSSGSTKTSSMLNDIGLSKSDILSTVRISFGKIHSIDDIEIVVKSIQNIVSPKKKNAITYEG